jgi:pimeloyl-ACP methyl ester carboxylesterase
MNWRWVRATLTALDRLPNVSAWSIALATRDVYQYLHNVRVRDTIEAGVRQALDGTDGAVVVSHSLGTVVAYNLLRREAVPRGWQVPLLVTVGSPLGVTNISRTLRPVSWPAPVGAWFNAYDPDDLVALHPLTAPWFPVDGIDDYGKVDNPTSNQHGISGYLSDARVAATILEALDE